METKKDVILGFTKGQCVAIGAASVAYASLDEKDTIVADCMILFVIFIALALFFSLLTWNLLVGIFISFVLCMGLLCIYLPVHLLLTHPQAMRETEEKSKTSIMLSASRAYDHAKEDIKGRCEEDELVIIKDSFYSYMYAKDIIKGRWKEAEPTIMADSRHALLYMENVINEYDTKKC
jgi:hypothetical protein